MAIHYIFFFMENSRSSIDPCTVETKSFSNKSANDGILDDEWLLAKSSYTSDANIRWHR